MRWATGTKKAPVTLKVEVKFSWVCDLSVHDGTSRAIARPITIALVLWEESNMVSLAYHDNRDLRTDFELLACL